MNLINPLDTYISKSRFKDLRPEILNTIKNKGYYILQMNNAFGELLDSSLYEYKKLVMNKKHKINPSSSSFKWDDIKDKYFTKYCIGSTNGLGNPIAQLLKTTYLPSSIEFLSKSQCNLFKLSKYLVTLRNLLSDLPVDFGYFPKKEKFWNASRIHHYPVGGGFMSRHIDEAFPSIMKNSKIPFLQVSVSLSIRSRDYFQGGGYVIDKQNHNKVYTDRTLEYPSSITIFDGSGAHGVEEVDPSEVFTFDPTKMRAALFASTYPFLK